MVVLVVYRILVAPGADSETSCVPVYVPGTGDALTTAYTFSTATLLVVVAKFPAASRATATMVCAPFLTVVVSQLNEYGVSVSSVPMFRLSILNWTPVADGRLVAETITVPETGVDGDTIVTESVAGKSDTPIMRKHSALPCPSACMVYVVVDVGEMMMEPLDTGEMIPIL